MGQVVVVGLDIAKSVFQVHGIDRDGGVVVRRRLRRARVLAFFATVEPCRIGIEACATGHYWARELRALGHDVRLMAPSYVKPAGAGDRSPDQSERALDRGGPPADGDSWGFVVVD